MRERLEDPNSGMSRGRAGCGGPGMMVTEPGGDTREGRPQPRGAPTPAPRAHPALSRPPPTRPPPPPPPHPQLRLDFFGLSEADLDKTFDASAFYGLGSVTLRELQEILRET